MHLLPVRGGTPLCCWVLVWTGAFYFLLERRAEREVPVLLIPAPEKKTEKKNRANARNKNTHTRKNTRKKAQKPRGTQKNERNPHGG